MNCPACGHDEHKHPWSDDEFCADCVDEWQDDRRDLKDLCEATRDDFDKLSKQTELEAWKAEARAAREYIEWLESFVPLTAMIVSNKEQAYLAARVDDGSTP